MPFTHRYAEQLSNLVTKVRPQALSGSTLAHYNQTLAEKIQLPKRLSEEKALLYSVFSPAGELAKHAVAQKYGGHQFGHWNPMLGDGRGVLLAEHQNDQGESWDLHLKGAGKTPYSRSGDGRAVLRSTIREYLASEYLHALGIPSSRALCLFTSEDTVLRESVEPAAMMIRVAPSHIRFGHFEYYYHADEPENLRALFEYCFEHHYPHLADAPNPHFALLSQIAINTAKMVARWQAYGFCHGVMNTDNMSIHGITFDYGPYAFLDDFQSDYICNHTDQGGRYAFDQQPGVALWNLNALGHSFKHYLSSEEIAAALGQYEPTLIEHFYSLMATRLGLVAPNTMLDIVNDSNEFNTTVKHLIHNWLNQLNNERRDYHLSHRLLLSFEPDSQNTPFVEHFIDQSWAKSWLADYDKLLNAGELSQSQWKNILQKSNPTFVLRNYHAQTCIDEAENGNFDTFRRYLAVLSSPFGENEQEQAFAKNPPDSQKGLALSCSS